MSRHVARKSIHRRRARAARSEEGAVMLVVLLILLVATASAAVSVANTQAELQAAGNERVAMQTRYVAEAGMATTLSWIVQLSNKNAFTKTFRSWSTPPDMDHYAEPMIVNGAETHHAQRTVMDAQLGMQQNPADEVPPLSNAVPLSGAGSGGGGGSSGSGGSGGSTPDTTGSFGPKQGYGLPSRGYVVDITDCQVAANALTPGSLVAGGSTSAPTGAFYCVMTGRGRLDPIGSAAERSWTLGGSRTFKQGLYSSAHDARAEFITPEMILE